ncbi:MAG: elongation factor P [bacterium]
MAKTSDIKKGFTFKKDGKMYTIIDFLHVKPGKGGAFVRTKVKNIETGQVIDMTFNSGERLDDIRLEKHGYQYLYSEGDKYYFMHNETYEQMFLTKSDLNGKELYLKENTDVDLLSVEGKIIDMEVPMFVELKIEETEPGIRGNTVSGGSKPAVCETGLKIDVPLFIEEGDIIKIDTRKDEYVERV